MWYVWSMEGVGYVCGYMVWCVRYVWYVGVGVWYGLCVWGCRAHMCGMYGGVG